jgi:hypothetical protein
MTRPQNKRMQLTKLRAAPERQDKVPPCAPAGQMDGGTASQLIRSVRRTYGRAWEAGMRRVGDVPVVLATVVVLLGGENAAPFESRLAGRFVSQYGFTVDIPPGYVAYPSAAVGDHGVIILLGDAGSRVGSMEFYGAGNVLFWKTVEEAVAARLEQLREDAVGRAVALTSRFRTSVQGVQAIRLVAAYRDQATEVDLVSDQVVLLRHRSGGDRLGVPDYQYSFGVVATAKEYEVSKKLFDRTLVTVRFSEPDE